MVMIAPPRPTAARSCRRLLLLLLAAALALLAPHGAAAQVAPQAAVSPTLQGAAPEDAPLFAGPVVMSEVSGKPANKSRESLAGVRDWAALTAAVEWVELHNMGASEADLSGWALVRADRDASEGWRLPAGVKLPAAGFLLVLCPRDKEVLPPIPAAATNVVAAHDIKVGANGLSLYAADGRLVASTGRLPRQIPGVTIGLPQPPAAAGNAPYTFLAAATPWAANAAARAGVGPLIRSTKVQPGGTMQPGTDLTVTAKVRPNQAPIAAVTLLTRVNYSPEQEVPMQAKDGDAGPGGEVTYRATIPGSNLTAGAMVRWRVKATDAAAGVSLEPNGQGRDAPRYEGLVVPVAAAEAVAANTSIPVLYWYTNNPAGSVTTAGAAGSLSFLGAFHDNVRAERRGVTSRTWTKPKLKFKVADEFTMREGVPPMTTVKLNSYFVEIGERSLMKEELAYKVLQAESAVSPLSEYVQLYLNGAFYGLFGLIEDVDSNLLERYGLPKAGPLFKSESGELSNLRWDLPLSEMPSYYSRPNRKQYAGDWQLLANFTRGLAGGGPVSRSSFLFDNLTLPDVINEAAIQTLLLNQDRCTKNFYVFYNPDKAEWIRIPWDVETSFAQDNGLGGTPGDYYCVLACEQWNSPLYCDSEHPQDLGNIKTPWGTITAVGVGNTYSGSAVPSSRGLKRRLTQQQQAAAAPAATPAPAAAPPAAAAPLPAEGTKPLTFPAPQGWDAPDRVQAGTKSVSGAAGTYNHLTDALFDVPATRAMYLRRLRTLADKYYGAGGQLRALVDATWGRVQGLAAADGALWKTGDGSRGYSQITSEFIPIRGKQLLQTYAPGGANPLLPGPQDNAAVALAIEGADVPAGNRAQSYAALGVRAPAGQAVDVSGWNLTVAGSGFSWSFPQGTVIPPSGRLHLSPSVLAFRARASSPKAGESVFVLQVPDQLLPQQGSTASWSVSDDKGKPVKLS